MRYGPDMLKTLPWPPLIPMEDGSFLVEWALELESELPSVTGVDAREVREAALLGMAVTLRSQGYPELVPTAEQTCPFQVQVEMQGRAALRLRLRLVDGAGNRALGLTAQAWIAIENLYGRIRSIQGVERDAWRLFLGPTPASAPPDEGGRPQ